MGDFMIYVARSRIAFLASLIVFVFSFFAAAASAADSDTVRATLSNGLRVVIVRNTLAPVVSTSVNYLVGSDEAPAGFPGMAHAQEHMMFRGSPELSADQLANIGSVMGGEFNANTRESLTQYLYTVPAEDIDVALHIEALRMAGVSDDEKAWDKERGAIEQEVAADLSTPSYKLYEKLRAELFAGTPYEHDALGTRPSFDKTTAAMLKGFHDKWYAPNNAILVVVGDLDPTATLATVKSLFGPLKARKLPARPKMAFKTVRPATLGIDTDSPYETEVIAMRLPGLGSRDFPALEVLADVLASHRFDLYGLVADGKALGANFSLDVLPKAGLGYASVSFPAGGDAKAIEQEMRAILAKAAKRGVPAELVARRRTAEKLHRRTGFGLVGCGRPLRPSFSRRRPRTYRESDGSRRQPRGAQIPPVGSRHFRAAQTARIG
jgi:zinc protease